MEKLTEETANALIEQISMANAKMEIAVDDFAQLHKSISNLALLRFLDTYAVNLKKFINASFVTRWYWEKKMNKSAKAVDEFAYLLDSLNNKNVGI